MELLYLVLLFLLCGAVYSVSASLDRMKKSLDRESAKVQTVLAEIRDKLGDRS